MSLLDEKDDLRFEMQLAIVAKADELAKGRVEYQAALTAQHLNGNGRRRTRR